MAAISPSRQRISRSSVAALLVAMLVFFIGIIDILSAWVGIARSRLEILIEFSTRNHLPLEIHHGSRTLTVMAGMLLLLLAWSLFRRKRSGWNAAVLLLALSAVLHVVKGLDVEEATLSLLALLVLLMTRRQFVVRSDPGSVAGAVTMSVLAQAGVLLYGVCGFLLLHQHFTPRATLSRAIQSTVAVVTQYDDPVLQPALVTIRPPRYTHWRIWRLIHHRPPPHGRHLDRNAVWFDDSLPTIAILGILYSAIMLLRPVAARLIAAESDRTEVRHLLEQHGGPPLAYWALLPGLHYYFAPDHRAVIAYRVVNGVAIALGDPLGDPDSIPVMVAAFTTLCKENDWRLAWYQVSARWLPLLREHGGKAMKIGEDALIDLPELTFTGKAWQNVRTALNKLPRDGYAAVWYDLATDPAGWLPRLQQISRAWVDAHGGQELGFSLGTWETALRFAAEQRSLVLLDPHGAPQAVLTFVPLWGGQGGWVLDLMRRGEDTPPQAMHFLLATALTQFREEGAELASLGLSALADSIPEEEPAAPELLERARGLIYEHFRRVYNFKGLHQFKEQFQPRWESRYLVYPSLLQLPPVLLALIRAHRVR